MFKSVGGTCVESAGSKGDVKATVESILEDIKEAIDENVALAQSLSTSVELLRSLQSQLLSVQTTTAPARST